MYLSSVPLFFFFNDTATTEIYTLSLHDAFRSRNGRSFPTSCSWRLIVFVDTTVRSLRSEEHTSELQSHSDLVCRLLLEKKKKKTIRLKQEKKIHNHTLEHCDAESARGKRAAQH